jgi:hypothetical protein
MNLEDIGNLGEAIGSLGLLITIVFLIIEMKWSRKESVRQQREQIFQSNLALELSLMGRKVHELEHRWSEVTSDMKQPYDRSLISDVFTEEELDFLKCRMNSVVWQANIVAEQRHAGVYSDQEWSGIADSVRRTLSPGTRDFFGIGGWTIFPRTRELTGLK